MCLVEVGEKKPDGTIVMRPQAGARLPDAGEGRHGDRRRQPEGEGGPAGDARVSAAQPSARLPHVRPGGRVLPAGLQLQVRPRVTAGCRSRRTSSRTRTTSATRSRCSPTAASCARRCVRFTREVSGTAELQVIGRGTRRRDRHLPRRAVQQQARRQRGRPVPRRRPVQQGLPLQAARVVAQDDQERLPQLQHRLQHRRRPERRPRLPPHAAAESAGPGALHVRRGPLRLEVHPHRRAAHVPGAARRTARSCRAAGTTSCRRCGRRSKKRAASIRKKIARRASRRG